AAARPLADRRRAGPPRPRPAGGGAPHRGAGLVFSALTDTCGMAMLLAKLPHNRPRTTDLNATLDTISR
ncbi:hypothetical protein ACFWMG_00445, partial [Streptomyces sp. NPDC127074]